MHTCKKHLSKVIFHINSFLHKWIYVKNDSELAFNTLTEMYSVYLNEQFYVNLKSPHA